MSARFVFKDIILGYIFEDVVWSLTWWGSIYENWKRQSVRGFSLDFGLLNVTSFTALSFNYAFGYFSESQADFVGKVSIPDMVFAFYGLLLSSLNFSQIFVYDRGKQKFTIVSLIVHVIFSIGMILALSLTVFSNAVVPSKYFSAIGVCGDFKILVTFVKYIPQVYLNYKRKSTQGWSIFFTFADIFGSLASLIDNVWDMTEDLNNFNAAKFCLGAFSLIFDAILLSQHYLLYQDSLPLSQRGSLLIDNDMSQKFTKVDDDESSEGDDTLSYQKGSSNN